MWLVFVQVVCQGGAVRGLTSMAVGFDSEMSEFEEPDRKLQAAGAACLRGCGCPASLGC